MARLEYKWTILFAVIMCFITIASAVSSYSARRRTESYDSKATRYPGGTLKRTMYTGRYCAFTKTKTVAQRVPNGTETYLKQVVTKCHWSSLYCTPRVNYVISTRLTHKTVMKKQMTEEWKCCPGFEGENCENTCYNCTTMTDLTERITQLEEQALSGIGPISGIEGNGSVVVRSGPKGDLGDTGPVGPRGLAGEPGLVGPRGPAGTPGPKGETGRPGLAGVRGVEGPAGEIGEKGQDGPKGEQGDVGQKGPKGDNGEDGEPGPAGPIGEKGMTGAAGIKGDQGERGIDGQNGTTGRDGSAGPPGVAGMKGEPGINGVAGPPGPPGECGCPNNVKGEPDPTHSPGGGSSACSYEGKYYSENEMWTNEDCSECMCVDGSVSCLSIACPNVSCTYKYKPAGYCCEICCPVQFGDEVLVSGDDEALYDDGAMETILHSEIDDPLLNATYDYEITESFPDVPMVDALGCPIAEKSALNSEFTLTDKCSLRKDPGPCSRSYQRYYYDKLRGQCSVFTFGGCEGNANSFLTMEECSKECMPQSSSQNKRSDAPQRLVEGPEHNPRFEVLPRRCREPKYVGRCRARFDRFYYDAEEDRCKIFVFGGCSANGNNFITPWECRDACGGEEPVHQTSDPERCLQPKETGPCRASFERYYFDSETNTCLEFSYGGCKGNTNNFVTKEECLLSCTREEEVTSRTLPPGICNKEMDIGPCRASMYRFFYDTETGRCSTFMYGGCRGNKNNFETPEECRQTCGGGTINYTITIPRPKKTPSVTGPRGPAGPRGRKGSSGPQGPVGPIGLPGLRGPPGPPGPPGTRSSTAHFQHEIEALKNEVQKLAVMVLSHMGEVGKHLDPTKHDDAGNFDDFFTDHHGASPDTTEYPDDYGLSHFPFSDYGLYEEEEEGRKKKI